MTDDRKRVLVTVPNEGWVRKELMETMLSLLMDQRYVLRFNFPVIKPIEESRNQLAKLFMSEGHDYWLSIDCDNVPMRNPLDLVALDKDIVGAPYPVGHGITRKGQNPVGLSGYVWHEESKGYVSDPRPYGLKRVDAVATGCILIARRVLESKAMMDGGPFTRPLNEDGTQKIGEDYAFCDKALKNGFEVWCNFDLPVMHIKEVELRDYAESLYAHFLENHSAKQQQEKRGPAIITPDHEPFSVVLCGDG